MILNFILMQITLKIYMETLNNLSQPKALRKNQSMIFGIWSGLIKYKLL